MTGAVRDSVEARTDAHPLTRRNAFGIFVCLRFSYFDDQVLTHFHMSRLRAGLWRVAAAEGAARRIA